MMNTYLKPFLIFQLLFLTLPSLAEDKPYQDNKKPIYMGELFNLRLYEVLPHDAAEYVDHYRSCRHFGGEDAYNNERAEQIRKGIEVSCKGLKAMEKNIHAIYKRGTIESKLINSIIKEIEAGESIPSFVLHDPMKKSEVLNEYYEAHAQQVVREVHKQIPEYEAILEKLRNETGKARDSTAMNLKMAKYKLGVQKHYLDNIEKNIDRLHSITREQIIHIEPKLSQVLAAQGQ